MRHLSETHRIEILMMVGYGNRSRTQQEVVRLFREKYPELPSLSQGTVSKIEHQFRENGHVRSTPSKRKSALDDNTKLNVLLTVQEDPFIATRQLAAENDICKTSVINTLKEQKYHPYKIQMVQELAEDDPDRRLQFCEEMMNFLDIGIVNSENILFSDEATFMLSGHVNRQNCRYWADRNPHWMREVHTQWPQKINVWAGIIKNQVIGPTFFENNLTGERYLTFLQEELVPNLAVLFPNALDPQLPNADIWFQQDGAPPHYARPVRDYLNQIFPNRWIGRRGPTEWPARSPDLTPLDFFLWGYLKSKVFKTKPENIEILKERIRQECGLITPDIIRNVRNGFYLRLGCCQQVNGHHFQHLLK